MLKWIKTTGKKHNIVSKKYFYLPKKISKSRFILSLCFRGMRVLQIIHISISEITSISPSSGSTEGGLTLTIYGNYFDDRAPYKAPMVYVGGIVEIVKSRFFILEL